MSNLSPEQQFAVGEIAIIQNARFYPNNGVEVVIIAPCEHRLWWNDFDGVHREEARYTVRRADGEMFSALPSQLRKKRPPEWPSQEQLKQQVPWKDCVWQPAGVKA